MSSGAMEHLEIHEKFRYLADRYDYLDALAALLDADRLLDDRDLLDRLADRLLDDRDLRARLAADRARLLLDDDLDLDRGADGL
ncbi:unnamed protein product [Didymodactylos carnosus]|uniref:Uncharacterized protein n=1 Tax=Didymodactylos carnosus TaxID=1234261 RepID=A0A8S2TBW7_9BILA|nr:unnamed protein product [Didymodactylos carnosus]